MKYRFRSSTASGKFRLRHGGEAPSSYAWLSARARNALRRRWLISVASGITFLAVLIALVLIPRQASRAVRTAVARIGPRPDTTTVISRRFAAATHLAYVDSVLAGARAALAAAAPAPTPPDTLSPELRAERDSLTILLTALTGVMAHAAEAPLPPSFRSLAQTAALRNSASVRVWLDSLNQVDKLREPFGALGAGDPIYVALTARVNELGRSIRDAAEQRRAELRSRLAPLTPPPTPQAQPSTTASATDTMQLTAIRDAATREYALYSRTLDAMRAQNSRIDSATAHARELANVGAPPAAMLAAALVIALALGFSLTLAGELRHPHVAHVSEAEAVAETRVLTVVRSSGTVERNHRRSVIEPSRSMDGISESYRTLYLHLAATGADVPIVTITGEFAPIVAAVAVNLAAVAAYEARSTLLVDVDQGSNAVAAFLRIPSDPGLAGMIAGRSALADSVVSTTIGRDRHLDVLPSGTGRVAATSTDFTNQIRHYFTRLEHRYDFIVIAAPTSYVQLPANTVIPTPDVILCARLGYTQITELRSAAQSLRGVGRHLQGVVLWDDDIPRLYEKGGIFSLPAQV